LRRPAPALQRAIGIAAFVPLAFSQFGWVSPSNFRGFDEWLILSLLSRGIVSFPYANRPLALVWALPAPVLSGDGLWGFLVMHAAYLGAAAVLTCLTLRRLWPRLPLMAWMAGAFSLAWAPTDAARLCSVQMIIYSGAALGCALALWLFAESFLRRSRSLLLLALCAGAITVLGGEAALGPLAMAPLLVVSSEAATADRRRARVWSSVWLSLLALGALRAAWPLVAGTAGAAYQARLVTSGAPGTTFAGRMLVQFREHLWPLVSGLPGLAHPATALALGAFAVGFVVETRTTLQRDVSPRRLIMLAGLGLLWAGLAYAPFVASPALTRPERTQFLSAAGIGLCLAAVVLLVARVTRGGMALAGLLGAFVVAQGTDRTLALQRGWDTESLYERQRTLLRQMVAAAPDLRPGTLVILLGGSRIFRLEAGIRHAVKQVYPGRAVGHAPDTEPFLYETRFTPPGITNEPWSSVRRAWDEPVAHYRYEEVVVFEARRPGKVALAEQWPAGLPPLPSGARYAPEGRILRDTTRPLPGFLR
jgi:hypothetical protein